MATPKPDHPWYGRNNHVKKADKDKLLDELLEREIERSVRMEQLSSDLADLDGDERAHRIPGLRPLGAGGFRHLPVRYED